MTPLQKLHAIRQMYRAIDEHLVKGAKDCGAQMDMVDFYDLTVEGRRPGADLLDGIGPRYDRMLKIYNGLVTDISVYVSERRQEVSRATQDLDSMLKAGC